MKTIVLLFTLLAACTLPADDPWDDMPGSKVTPVFPDGQDWWYVRVEAEAAQWAKAVEPHGCPAPFLVVPEGGRPVRLVPPEEWRHPANKIGVETPDGIDIRWYQTDLIPEGRWTTPILLHEMGHALGLEHSDNEYEAMHTPAWEYAPAVREGELAAMSIGCL